jgi:hypothetical protein
MHAGTVGKMADGSSVHGPHFLQFTAENLHQQGVTE